VQWHVIAEPQLPAPPVLLVAHHRCSRRTLSSCCFAWKICVSAQISPTQPRLPPLLRRTTHPLPLPRLRQPGHLRRCRRGSSQQLGTAAAAAGGSGFGGGGSAAGAAAAGTQRPCHPCPHQTLFVTAVSKLTTSFTCHIDDSSQQRLPVSVRMHRFIKMPVADHEKPSHVIAKIIKPLAVFERALITNAICRSQAAAVHAALWRACCRSGCRFCG